MANKKISDLTAKGANLEATDLFEIAEDAGGGTYVAKSITGAEIIAAGTDTNFANSALTFTANRTHDLAGYKATFDNAELKVIADADTSGDVPFEITQANGTDTIVKVLANRTFILPSSGVINAFKFDYSNSSTPTITVVGDVTTINYTAIGTSMSLNTNGYTGRTTLSNSQTTGGGLTLQANGTGATISIECPGGIIIPPITATAASALTPAEGMELNVSNTNGTFTSIGKWQYIGGAWVKL